MVGLSIYSKLFFCCNVISQSSDALNITILLQAALIHKHTVYSQSNPHPFYSFRGLKKSDAD
jgi:hypothetical protein